MLRIRGFIFRKQYRGADNSLARPGRKQTTATEDFNFHTSQFLIINGGILVLFMYKTRLASNEIFSPSNKIYREVGRAKDLSAPRQFMQLRYGTFYMHRYKQSSRQKSVFDTHSHSSIAVCLKMNTRVPNMQKTSKLKIKILINKCACRWLMLYNYITIHSGKNLKFIFLNLWIVYLGVLFTMSKTILQFPRTCYKERTSDFDIYVAEQGHVLSSR